MSDPRPPVPRPGPPRPAHTPKSEEVDPIEGTEPDGTPVENPSG